MATKRYYLADGTPLTDEERQRISEHNREILALPDDEFIRRVHELRFMVAKEA